MVGMQVRLNGEVRALPDGETVGALLARLGVRPERVAVVVNGVVVTRARHGAHALGSGDAVEIVALLGGA